MPHMTHYLPELEEAERSFIQYFMDSMSHDQALLFASAYRHRRKDPHTVLLTAIVGLVAIPGLQRFWLGQVGMGFLYLFTWGLILIGTIHDLVRYKELALSYNHRVAREVAANIQLQEAKPRSTFRQRPLISPSTSTPNA